MSISAIMACRKDSVDFGNRLHNYFKRKGVCLSNSRKEIRLISSVIWLNFCFDEGIDTFTTVEA